MTEEENTKSMFVRTVNSLSFVFKQKPVNMFYVLNALGNFDDLLVLALAADELSINIDDAYRIVKKEEELKAYELKQKAELKEKMGEVVQLWKNQPDSSAETANSS